MNQFGIYVIDDNDKITVVDYGTEPAYRPQDVQVALAAAADQARAAVVRVGSLESQVQSLETRLAKQREFLDKLVADAHEYADQAGLCSQFDDFMAQHNLPTRKRTYRVGLRRTVTETYEETAVVFIEASSEDEARDLVDGFAADWSQTYSDADVEYGDEEIEDVQLD